jgi:gliding motility-associated-like protein
MLSLKPLTALVAITAMMLGLSANIMAQCQQDHIQANRVTGCAPYIASLQAVEVPANANLNWIIGQDTLTDRSKVSKAYRKAQTLDVTVMIKQDGQLTCKQTKDQLIEVYAKPKNFSLITSDEQLCEGPADVNLQLKGASASRYDWVIANERYTDTGSSVTHTFTSTGKKTISVKAISDKGCKTVESFDEAIRINQKPELSVTADNNTGVGLLQSRISLESGAELANVSWSFPGAASTENMQSDTPTVSYNKPGTYRGGATVKTTSGCQYQASVEPALQVIEPVTLSFGANKTSVCPNEPIRLTNQASHLKGSFRWILESDNAKATFRGRDTVLQISEGGTYSVTLEYTRNGVSQQQTKKNYIKVQDFNADFSATPACNCRVPVSIKLNSHTESANGTTYQWTVLDDKGNTVFESTKANPSAFMQKKGTYDVQLIAENSQGCHDSTYREDFLELGQLTQELDLDFKTYAVNQPIHLAFPSDSFCTNDSLHVTWLVWNEAKTQLLNQSKERNPRFTFQDSGQYRISLKVATKSGCKQGVSTNPGSGPIDIKDPDPDFGIDTGQAGGKTGKSGKGDDSNSHTYCKGENFTLVQQTVPSALNYTHHWTITHQDDTTIQFTGKGETFDKSLAEPGVYNVTYTAAVDSVTAFVEVKKGFLKIRGTDVSMATRTLDECIPYKGAVKARLDPAHSYPAPGQAARTFKWQEPASPHLQLDRKSAVSANAKIDASGSYDVTYSVTDSAGCADTFTAENLLQAGVEADFSLPDHTCYGNGVKAQNKSFASGGEPAYEWTTLNGGAKLQNASDSEDQHFNFTDSGNYEVQLAVTSARGCTDTQKATTEVERVFADFSSPDTFNTCAPVVVDFEVQSSPNVSTYRWDFGDNHSQKTTKTNISNVYTRNSGDSSSGFDISMTATSGRGCSKTITKDKYVTVLGPVIDFELSSQEGCEPMKVDFNLSGENYTAAFASYDDNSNLDTAPDLQHTYKVVRKGVKQTFDPFVLARDAQGCFAASQLDEPLTVHQAPESAFSMDTASGCSPVRVTFQDETAMSVTKMWHFSDKADPVANAAHKKAQQHSFPQGEHTVSMVATSKAGCKDTLTMADTIQSYSHPEVDFAMDQDQVCPEAAFDIVNQSDGKGHLLTAHQWVIAGEDHTDTMKQEHARGLFYSNPAKSFDVTLTTTNEKGCTSTRTREDFIDILAPVEHAPALKRVTYQEGVRPSAGKPEKKIHWNESQEESFDHYTLLTKTEEGTKPIADIGDLQQNQYTHKAGRQEQGYQLLVEGRCGFHSDTTGLDAASDLAVETPEASTNQLSWTAYQGWSGVEGYRIMRSTEGEPFQAIDTLSPGRTQYTDAGLCREEYSYQVVAIKPEHRYQSWSMPAAQIPEYKYPTFRHSLTNSTIKDDKLVTTWERPETWTPHSYVIQRKTTGTDNYQTVAEGVKVEQYIDSSAKVEDQAYQYRVEALDHCSTPSANSGFSSSVYLEAEADQQNIELSWQAARDWRKEVSSYKVQVKKQGADFETIASVPGDQTVYQDQNLSSRTDTTPTYRIKAYQANGQISTSNRASATSVTLYVPNAFTPNQDGLNESFKVEGQTLEYATSKGFQSFSMEIYNQWGEKIFETSDPTDGWDGTGRNGEQLSGGTFIYRITARTQQNMVSRKGKVDLIR